MYEDLLRELRCCPDAEYGCSRCGHIDSLHCRETLMKESANAIEKLKEELADKPKWISVKERLPERCGYYLVFTNNFGTHSIAVSKYADYGTFKSWCIKTTVTHWMQLPEPPKEGGGE